jgi:hypothetical protein
MKEKLHKYIGAETALAKMKMGGVHGTACVVKKLFK